MPDFITLTCPSCGGKLQITDKILTFACGHCGNEHIVHREGGAIYLAPMAQDVRQIRVGVDKTAAELAVARLTKEIAELEAKLFVSKTEFDKQPSRIDQSLGCLSIGGLVLAGTLIITLFTVQLGMVQIALAIAVVVCFVLGRNLLDGQQKAEQQRLKLQKPIETMLRSKSEQLEKNRRIAES